jgi:predicted permease
VPAFRATDLQAGPALQDAAGRGVVGGGRRGILSGALVVAQIALSLLLVAGAGLLVQTLVNLQHADLGFDASRLLIFRIDPTLNNYTGARADDLFSSLLDRLRAAPGVTGASLSSHTLISNSSGVGVVIRPDETVPDPSAPGAAAFSQSHLGWSLTIDESFFQTMGIPVLRGRGFTRSDGGPAQVVVVNRSLARQLYGSDDVVGRSLAFGSLRRHRVPIQIIGVVEDARYTSVRRDKPPTLYYFYRQQPMKAAATFEVKTAGPPEALAATPRHIVRGIDPNLPLASVMTQEDQIARSLRQERLFARLATLLGGVALALCAIGLYGLLAYGVARRTAEIGLRIALGAERTTVQWMVLRESLWLAALGLAAGVPAALFGTKLLAAMLFGLAPRDPVTIGGAAVAMLALAGIAGYIPARRAAGVDPMLALRAE